MSSRKNIYPPESVKPGAVFHRVTVISDDPDCKVNVLCICECGTKWSVWRRSLYTGGTKSCGCFRREFSARKCTKHGMFYSRIYAIWVGMRQRCNNPRNQRYTFYGARGIKVCKRWDNFEDFLSDVGHPPDGMSLDRINNNGDYEPGNVRWATHAQQMLNTRKNRHIEFDGQVMTVSQWAKKFGISPGTLSNRVFVLGWDIAKALTTPPAKKRPRPRSS